MIRFNYQYVLCRLCLSNNSSLCDIHSSEVEKGSSVAGVVTDLLQLDVSKTDGHPQLVCLSCLHKLYDFKKFKEKCYKAKSKFEMHLKSNNLFLHVRKPNQKADGQVEEKVFPVTFRQRVPETLSENSVSGSSSTSSEECSKTMQEEKCIAECNKCAMKFTTQQEFIAHANEHSKEDKLMSSDAEHQDGITQNEESSSTGRNTSDEQNQKEISEDQSEKVVEGNQITCEFFIKEEPTQGLDLFQEDEYSGNIDPLSPESSQNDSSNALPSENLKTEHRGNESANEDGIHIKQEFLQENMEQSTEENTLKNISDNSEANPKTRSLLLCIPIAKKLPATNQPANLPINLQNKVQQSVNIIPTCEEEEWKKKLVEHEAEQINPIQFPSPQNSCSNLLLNGNSIKISSVESLKENSLRIRQEFTQGIMGKSIVQNAVKIIPNNSAVNQKTQSVLLCIPIAKKLPGTSPPQIPTTRPPMPINLPMGLQMKGRRRRKVPPKATSEDGEKSQISCEVCGKTFTQKHTLKIHKYTHMKIKPYQCTICKKDFAQSSTMRRHMSRSHVEKKFQCFLCPRKFAKEKCLEAHIKIHRGYRPFNCSWCNTGFCSKEAMEKHEALHAGDVPFKCDFCGKEFDHKRKISWHIRCSHMTKNEVCNLCGAHFRSEANLKIHMTLHTDERNFMCEVCGKTFRRRNCLSVHRRTHTGERPYQCELCDKRFTQKHCLKGHMERHQRESW